MNNQFQLVRRCLESIAQPEFLVLKAGIFAIVKNIKLRGGELYQFRAVYLTPLIITELSDLVNRLHYVDEKLFYKHYTTF